MQQMEWKLVPTQPTAEMVGAGAGVVFRNDDCEADEEPYRARGQAIDAYTQMVGAAPEPPHLSMTKEEAATFQDWRGMDGACAFHLIERHANGWGDTERMMEAWLAANAAPSNAAISGAKHPIDCPVKYGESHGRNFERRSSPRKKALQVRCLRMVDKL